MIAAHQTMLAPQGGPSTLDYVQDGLVGMWDGIENAGRGVHDANATTWKDLVGSCDMTKVGSSTFGSSFADLSDQTYFIRSGSFSEIRNLILSRNFTLEVVCRSASGAYLSNADAVFVISSSVTDNDYSQRGLVISDTGDGTYTGNRFSALQVLDPSWAGINALVRTGISASEDVSLCVVCNNSAVQYLSNTTSIKTRTAGNLSDLSKTKLSFGKYLYDRTDSNGRIYAVRIYNRVLTTPEIAANYAIDKARFNLP